MAVDVINIFTGGQAPNFYATNRHLIKQVRPGGFAYGLNLNPYVDIGVLTPGSTKTPLTNASVMSGSSTIHSFEYDDSTAKAYGIENSAKVHQIDVATDTFTNTATFPHTITASGSHSGHLSIGGVSLAWYYLNGVRRLYYAWNDATDGDVGSWNLVSTFNDNTISGSTTGAALGPYPHPLLVAENGFMYIPDGNAIHKFDGNTTGGATGTLTANAIDTALGWVFTASMDFNGYGFFGAIRTFNTGNSAMANLSFLTPRQCRVYVWTYTSTQAGNAHGFYQIYRVDKATFIYKLVVYEGVPAVICHGIDNTVQLRTLVGSETRLIQSFPAAAGPATGGVSAYKNMLMWIGGGSIYGGGGNGSIYTHGTPAQDFPAAVNQIQGTGGLAGGLISVGTDKYYVGENNSVSTFTIGTGAILSNGAYYQSEVREIPKKSRIKGINIYWPPTTTADTGTDSMQIFVNNAQTPTAQWSIQLNTNSAKGFLYLPFDKPDVNNYYIKYTFNQSITDIPNCIRPSRFEIIYDDTTKLK